MLFKMIALERAAEQSRIKIRQVFVTQSRVLAGRVEEYFNKLVSTARTASGSAASDGGGDGQPPHQASTKTKDELLDLDDEADDDERLPGRWSELQDHHFPLFVTFDQVRPGLSPLEQPSLHTSQETLTIHAQSLYSFAGYLKGTMSSRTITLRSPDSNVDSKTGTPSSLLMTLSSNSTTTRSSQPLEKLTRDNNERPTSRRGRRVC